MDNYTLLYSRSHGKLKNTKFKNKEVNGFDTETLNGSCILITSYNYDDTKDVLFSRNLDDILSFLTQYKYRDSLNFFYNLTYDVEGILNKLDLKYLQEIAIKNKTIYKDYVLYYIPKKFFKIVKDKHCYYFYDCYQFYNLSLDEASKQYLNLNKKDFNVELITEENLKNSFFVNDLISYCIHDSMLCQKLSELLVNNVSNVVKTNRFISQASISEDYFRRFITIVKIPSGVNNYFLNAYHGGRFEIFKKGYLRNAREYDIKSAYPFWISKLKILTDDYDLLYVKDKFNDDCLYGAYKIRIKTNFDYLGYLCYQHDNKLLYCNFKSDCYYIDKDTLVFLHDSNVDYRVIDGYELYDYNASELLYDKVNELYMLKEKHKKDNMMLSNVYKIILNSLYGKFIQMNEKYVLREIDDVLECDNWEDAKKKLDYISEHKLYGGFYIREKLNNVYRVGNMFNSVYACFITSNTRLQLLKEVLKHNFKDLYAFHTDSILCGYSINESNSLGGWELSNEGDLILVKAGVYQINNKIRNRGIRRNSSLFDNTYRVKRRIGIKQACNKNYSKINVLEDRIVCVDLNADKKRYWFSDLSLQVIEDKSFIDSDILCIN